MSDSQYTEVTSQSWFSRIGGAIKGILFGVILVVIAFPLLFWNEGRAVKRHKALKEGAGIVVSVSIESVDQLNDGKLVHLIGKAETDAILSDPIFAVSENAIHLRRQVEMFQWQENVKSDTKNKVGGGTETTKTYSYEKVWSSKLINSSEFKKAQEPPNPEAIPFSSAHYTADRVKLGAFVLSSSLIHQINNFAPLALATDTTPPETLGENAKVRNSGFYIGANPTAPQIGDVRVKFMTVKPTLISIVARQTGDSFEPYTTSVGGTIELLEIGNHSANKMFENAQQANRMLTWALRFVGFLMFLIGFNLILKPLSVVADVLPIMGRIVEVGTGLIALLISTVLSLIVITIAWIFYRPLLGILLLIVAIGLSAIIIKKLKGSK